MGIAYVKHAVGSYGWGNSATVDITPAAAGNLLIAYAYVGTTDITISVSDDVNGAYTALTKSERSGTIQLFWVTCDADEATITASFSKTNNCAVGVVEISGAAAEPIDLDIVANGYGTDIDTADESTAQNNELLLFAANISSSSYTVTPDADWTEIADGVYKWVAYRIVSSTGSYPGVTAIGVINGSQAWSGCLCSVKEEAAGGISIPVAMYHYMHH